MLFFKYPFLISFVIFSAFEDAPLSAKPPSEQTDDEKSKETLSVKIRDLGKLTPDQFREEFRSMSQSEKYKIFQQVMRVVTSNIDSEERDAYLRGFVTNFNDADLVITAEPGGPVSPDVVRRYLRSGFQNFDFKASPIPSDSAPEFRKLLLHSLAVNDHCVRGGIFASVVENDCSDFLGSLRVLTLVSTYKQTMVNLASNAHHLTQLEGLAIQAPSHKRNDDFVRSPAGEKPKMDAVAFASRVPSLESLGFINYGLFETPDSREALLSCLSNHPNLKRIGLLGNGIQDEHVPLLLNVFGDKHLLQELDLRNNPISERAQKLLTDFASKRKIRVVMNLSSKL